MARPQTIASLEAKEELTLKQIQELEDKLRAKKAQLKKVQTQTLTASNKKFKEYGLEAMGSAVIRKEREAAAIDTATSAEEHE